MTEPVILADSDVLPEWEKDIRNAIKQILTKEPRLKDLKGIYNTTYSIQKPRDKPYCYVMFLGRTNDIKGNDIEEFRYFYDFEVGVIVELKTGQEDHLDDLALDFLNIIESALTKNKLLLGTVDLYHYPAAKRNDTTFQLIPNTRKLSLTIRYSNYVPYNTL